MSQLRRFLIFFVCSCFALVPWIAWAGDGNSLEVLHLKTGDRLTGVSVGVSDGRVRWRLPHGGELNVPLDEIKRIDYAPLAPIVGPNSGVESSKSSSSVSESAPMPQLAAESDGEAEVLGGIEAVSQAFRATYRNVLRDVDDWTKRLEIGGRILDGNSDQDFIDVATKFEKQEEGRHSQLNMGGQYSQSNGDRNSNRWWGNATIDFDRDSNWILFLTAKNEYDEFENLDYRGTLSSGIGYRFSEGADKRFVVRIGPGVTYEKFNNPVVNRTTADVFGEFEYQTQLFQRTRFEVKSTINPSVEDIKIVRLISNYGLLLQLDESEQWSLKFGFRHEYNSRPNENRQPNDFTTSILLVYTRN